MKNSWECCAMKLKKNPRIKMAMIDSEYEYTITVVFNQ